MFDFERIKYSDLPWLTNKKDAKFLHADNEDYDQNARMRRLIWVFVGRTCQKVRFLMLQWWYFFSDFFFQETRIWHYMKIVSIGKFPDKPEIVIVPDFFLNKLAHRYNFTWLVSW